MPARSRQLLFIIVSAILMASLLLGMLWALRAERAAAQSAVTPDRASVIVQFDDHATHIRAVDVTAPISGLAALQASGLDVVVADSGFGPAVCAIAGVGCPADDCFCRCDGGDT